MQNQVLDSLNGPFAKHDRLELFIEERNRAICFGEALRAICDHFGEDMVCPPDQATLRLLEIAYRKMKTVWDDFSPQDFTLYAMSLLVAQLEDEEDIRRFRRGAAQYLLDVKPQISTEFQKLTINAQVLLESVPAASKRQWGFPDLEQQVITPIRKDLDSPALQQINTEPAQQKPEKPSEVQVKNSIYRRSTVLHRRNNLRAVKQNDNPTNTDQSEDAIHLIQAPVTSVRSDSKTALLTAALALLLIASLIAVVLYYVEIPTPSR